MLRPSSSQQVILTMPWDIDRYHSKSTDMPKKTTSSYLNTTKDPPLSSNLFSIPRDILEHVLDRMTKKDAFRLSQTCKTFMGHFSVLKAIFHVPISLQEIDTWYRDLPDCRMDKKLTVGPPVTWAINASTGPYVRRLALPEWTSEQDIHYLTAHCPNLNAMDFLGLFEFVPHPKGWHPGQESDDEDNEEVESVNFWPPMLDQCPALFRNLTYVHLPYGCWRTVYGRLHCYHQNHIASLPKILSLAENLQNLTISCQQEPTTGTSPDTRRKASAELVIQIVNNVSRELTSLALYDTASTIDNLDSFTQSLTVFPKLRTIRLSLHRDLFIYQKMSHSLYDFDAIVNPILSCTTKDYEHDTASVLQYLSIIKKISDRGRFTLVSLDNGEEYHYLPSEFYGLCQAGLVPGPLDNLWTPVWTWNDRLHWVEDHDYDPLVETVDIEACRALFGGLIEARVPVSVELEPLSGSSGAIFADTWYDEAGNVDNEDIPSSPTNGAVTSGQQPRQHFILRGASTVIKSNNTSTFDPPLYIDQESVQMLSSHCTLFEDEPSDTEYEINLQCHAPTVVPRNLANRDVQPDVKSSTSHTINPDSDIPDPI